MKKQTYSELLKAYYDMAWEVDFRLAYEDTKNYLRACKEMTRIETKMKSFTPKNVEAGI